MKVEKVNIRQKKEDTVERLLNSANDVASSFKKYGVVETLEKHFDDDIKHFNKINELLRLNGDHMSHFRKDLIETKESVSEIKDMLRKQNEEYRINNDVYKRHMEKVEPMLVSYEENAIFLKGAKKRGGWFVAGAGIIVTISAGWYVLKNFLINLR